MGYTPATAISSGRVICGHLCVRLSTFAFFFHLSKQALGATVAPKTQERGMHLKFRYLGGAKVITID